MKKIIFKSMLVTSLRDKITLFYSLMFPLGLMIGLGLYFEEGYMPIRILSGITAISTIFWGMQGIAFQVHFQRNRGVYKLLKLTPMPILSFVLIMTLARTAIGIVLNMSVWTAGILFFQMNIDFIMIINTLLLVTIGTLCFTSIGFLIANFANNEGQINMYSNLIQLPMIFMSEAFYQLNHAPEWVVTIGKALPFESYVKGIRSVISGETESILIGLLIPMVYTIIALGLSAPTFKWEVKQGNPRQKAKKLAS